MSYQTLNEFSQEQEEIEKYRDFLEDMLQSVQIPFIEKRLQDSGEEKDEAGNQEYLMREFQDTLSELLKREDDIKIISELGIESLINYQDFINQFQEEKQQQNMEIQSLRNIINTMAKQQQQQEIEQKKLLNDNDVMQKQLIDLHLQYMKQKQEELQKSKNDQQKIEKYQNVEEQLNQKIEECKQQMQVKQNQISEYISIIHDIKEEQRKEFIRKEEIQAQFQRALTKIDILQSKETNLIKLVNDLQNKLENKQQNLNESLQSDEFSIDQDNNVYQDRKNLKNSIKENQFGTFTIIQDKQNNYYQDLINDENNQNGNSLTLKQQLEQDQLQFTDFQENISDQISHNETEENNNNQHVLDPFKAPSQFKNELQITLLNKPNEKGEINNIFQDMEKQDNEENKNKHNRIKSNYTDELQDLCSQQKIEEIVSPLKSNQQQMKNKNSTQSCNSLRPTTNLFRKSTRKSSVILSKIQEYRQKKKQSVQLNTSNSDLNSEVVGGGSFGQNNMQIHSFNANIIENNQNTINTNENNNDNNINYLDIKVNQYDQNNDNKDQIQEIINSSQSSNSKLKIEQYDDNIDKVKEVQISNNYQKNTSQEEQELEEKVKFSNNQEYYITITKDKDQQQIDTINENQENIDNKKLFISQQQSLIERLNTIEEVNSPNRSHLNSYNLLSPQVNYTQNNNQNININQATEKDIKLKLQEVLGMICINQSKIKFDQNKNSNLQYCQNIIDSNNNNNQNQNTDSNNKQNNQNNSIFCNNIQQQAEWLTQFLIQNQNLIQENNSSNNVKKELIHKLEDNFNINSATNKPYHKRNSSHQPVFTYNQNQNNDSFNYSNNLNIGSQTKLNLNYSDNENEDQNQQTKRKYYSKTPQNENYKNSSNYNELSFQAPYNMEIISQKLENYNISQIKKLTDPQYQASQNNSFDDKTMMHIINNIQSNQDPYLKSQMNSQDLNGITPPYFQENDSFNNKQNYTNQQNNSKNGNSTLNPSQTIFTRQNNKRESLLQSQSPYRQYYNKEQEKFQNQNEGNRTDPYMEYFLLSCQAAKLNSKYFDQIYNFKINSIKAEIDEKKIPFNKWYDYISERLHSKRKQLIQRKKINKSIIIQPQ